MHWADIFAKQVVEKREKEEYVVESGITPSGIIHIGNCREILTQYFVYLGILKLGKKAKFIYIWDDFDRFRKVPKGIPENFKDYIGMPVSFVPDPWNCHKSYAEHFESNLEEETKKIGIEPKYFSATELYKNGTFIENIRIALEKTEKIKEILNKFRLEPLPNDWLPINLYCEKCGKDFTKIKYLGDYKISYKCDCGFENEIDFRKRRIIKLKWRVDWASRWAYFKVDFESSGKEHKSKGGSFDTSILISKEIFNYDPPIGPMYEFIHLKGQKEKMSSSKGNVATISQLLKIFEPPIIRFLYTQRLNKTIFIPFDLDIYNIYNDFDKSERVYFGLEKGDEDLKRKYELSKIEDYSKCPKRISFSELVFIVQFVPKEKLREYLKNLMLSRDVEMDKQDLDLALERAERAKYWVENYAPEEVKIKLSSEKIDLTKEQKEILSELLEIIKRESSTEELQKQIFEIAKRRGNEVFKISYLVLIGKKYGPKLAMLIDAIGREKVIERFLKLLDY